MRQSPSPRKAALVVILLVAFGVRLILLDDRALWFDEGVTLTFARMPLTDLVEFKRTWVDTNPPAYQLSVGAWTWLVGVSPFTARIFSVFAGVLSVATLAHIGERIGAGRRAAVLAALIMAILPVQVYFSREAKGYAAIQLALLLLVILWYALKENRPYAIAGIIGCTAFAVGSHYMSILGFVALNTWAVWEALTERASRTRLLIWFTAQAIGGLLWVPFLLATISTALVGANTAAVVENAAPLSIPEYALTFLQGVLAGPIGPETMRALASVVVGVLALVGVATVKQARALRWVVPWLVVPLVLGYLVQLEVPFFFPRFVMYASAGAALAMGAGLAQFNRRQLGTWALVAVAFGSLIVANVERPQPEPDLRALAADLERRAMEGDALLYSYSWQPGMLAAYLPDDASRFTTYATFFDNVPQALRTITLAHERVWLLTFEIGAESSANDVGRWLLLNTAWGGGSWYDDTSQLNLFATRMINRAEPTLCSDVGEDLFALCVDPVVATIEQGDVLPIRLWWEALGETPLEYTVFIHVLEEGDPQPVAQRDSQPTNGQRRTPAWEPGDEIVDRQLVDVSTLPPGDYRIVVGMYNAPTDERLRFDDGTDTLDIGTLTITE